MRPRSGWFDRPFGGWSTVFAAAHLRTPDLDAVRAATARLLAADPTTPPALQVHGGLAWLRPDLDPTALAARLVVPAAALDVGPGPDVSAAIARRAEAEPPLDPDLPFRLTLGPDHLVATVDHVIGDAAVASPLVTGLLQAAAGDDDAVAGLLRPTSGGLLRPVLGTLARRLERQPPAVIDDVPVLPRGEWRLHHGVAHAVLGAAANRSSKVEARRLGVRRSSLVMALVEQAIAAEGLAPADDVRTVVVDCRRYLDEGQVVRGNFSAGTAVAARWTDPRDVDTRVDHALEHARPLLHLLAGAVTARRGTRAPRPVVRTPDPAARVRVHADYSVVVGGRTVGRLPWSGPPHFLSATRPQRPDAFGVIVLEAGGTLQVSVSHDRDYLEPAAVQRVLGGLAGRLEQAAG